MKSMTEIKQYRPSTLANQQDMNRGCLTPHEIQAIAAARLVNERAIDASAEKEGAAVREVRAVMGVVARRPGKKRGATSGCGANGRKFHARLSALPSANSTPDVVRSPVVITGGRTKDGKPFKGSIVCKGLTDKVIARAVKKREKFLQGIIDGK